MPIIASTALICWLPIVAIIFLSQPPKRAVVASYVFAWLALPNIGFSIPAFPNYTKMTATVVGVMLCVVMFNFSKLVQFRPRWYDLPMLVWCVSPFVTALTNDLGSYEGLSATLDQIMSWGLPYLIGRLYLNDVEGIRELCVAMTIGGIAYVPLCLIEMRLSPVMDRYVYGHIAFEAQRLGGWRPKVFLATGLELGMWMANATLIGYQLWSCGTVKTIRGAPFGWLMAALLITTIFCRSTGALILMLVGIGALWAVRLTKKSWPIWVLILIPPTYSLTRTLDLWSGREVVDIATATVGEERALSFEYRLNMEKGLAARAMERPIFGWGRFGRNLIFEDNGKMVTVPDGFWIITLGMNGSISLVALLLFMLLPMTLTIRRFPVSTWRDPQVGPLVVLGLVLVLEMADFLSNAMINPIYALAVGGLIGQVPIRLSGGLGDAEKSLHLASDLMSQGHVEEAAWEFERTIELVSDGDDVPGRKVHARALDGLGHSMAALRRFDQAEEAFRDALMVRDWLAVQGPEAARFQDLAIARQELARLFAETGRPLEAVEERQIALKIWDILVADHPRNTDYRKFRIEALNDLAWLIANEPDPTVYNPAAAVSLAEEAVNSAGKLDAPWNTLGVARYRTGDWAGAIEALERSALSSIDGRGTAFDHFFISMAWGRLQHETQAREWLERGIAWTARHRPAHPTLERFREEAEYVLRTESEASSPG